MVQTINSRDMEMKMIRESPADDKVSGCLKRQWEPRHARRQFQGTVGKKHKVDATGLAG